MGAGVGAGAAVVAALFTLALIGLSGGAVSGAPPWARAIERTLAQRGYDWISIGVADKVATVSGVAPDVDSHRFGFEAAEEALGREPDVAIVVDATSLEGGPAGVGAALAALGPEPDLGACQQAFVATLDGRAINFKSGSASLDGDNRRLLDTLSGVAIRCDAFRIEIAGHTDTTGAPRANQTLSEERAATVRGYLMGKGVNGETLTATGFGSTRPVDVSGAPEADARNRRIEFTVSAS